MDLSVLRNVYEQDGPVATVYLEARSPGEDAGEQLRLRWKALREQLSSAGAPESAIETIESELANDPAGEKQADGRVLVATESAVVLDEPWDAALGAGDVAHWTRLPELGAYARERTRAIRELVVIADQTGAQVRQEVVAEQHEPRELDAEDVEGGAVEGVHKPRGGALSHNQIQRRADEAVLQNAKDVVSHLRSVAGRFDPHVLVLAGEVQARTEIREQLPAELTGLVVETDRGGRDAGASDESLTEEMLRIADEASRKRAEQNAERLEAGLAHEQAVQGGEQVAHAAEMGAVETLLFEDGVPASREAFLLSTCAQTSSSVSVVPRGTGLAEGVGAILRYPLNA